MQTDRDAAAHLAGRIKQTVADHRFELGHGDTVRLTCSIGFTFFPFMPSAPNLFSWEQVLDMADQALYRAKQAGRDRWVGVLSVPQVDPAVLMKHKDDDLEQLASADIVELPTDGATPSSLDEADPLSLNPPGPRLVGRAG